MNDNDIRDLFKEYQPEIGDDFRFLVKLQRSIEAAEIVRQHNEAVIKSNRIAMVISVILAFISGIVFTILQPRIQILLENIFYKFRNMVSSFRYEDIMAIGSWIIIATFVLFLAFGCYNIVGFWFSKVPVKIHSRS